MRQHFCYTRSANKICFISNKLADILNGFINPPIKYPIYLLQIASDCNIIFGCQKKKILGNYQ